MNHVVCAEFVTVSVECVCTCRVNRAVCDFVTVSMWSVHVYELCGVCCVSVSVCNV